MTMLRQNGKIGLDNTETVPQKCDAEHRHRQNIILSASDRHPSDGNRPSYRGTYTTNHWNNFCICNEVKDYAPTNNCGIANQRFVSGYDASTTASAVHPTKNLERGY